MQKRVMRRDRSGMWGNMVRRVCVGNVSGKCGGSVCWVFVAGACGGVDGMVEWGEAGRSFIGQRWVSGTWAGD